MVNPWPTVLRIRRGAADLAPDPSRDAGDPSRLRLVSHDESPPLTSPLDSPVLWLWLGWWIGLAAGLLLGYYAPVINAWVVS